jgi:N-acetylneuraminate synthase/pseudaminic acid synthase
MTKNIFENITNISNNKVAIIVEMSGNHKNSIKAMKNFVKKTVELGGDIIKFQVYTPDTITLNSNKKDFLVKSNNSWKKYNTLYNLYKKAHTPWAWIEKVAKDLNKIKFPWFASAFDFSSVEFLEKLNCPAYKIASPEITDIGLIKFIAKTKKPIFLSTGLASLKDIDLAVKTIKKIHNKFAILKCTSLYPASHQDLNLKAIQFLKKKYKCAIGFSDHSTGDLASKVAVSLGATIIEKHFKLDNDKISIDSEFSMNLSKLKDFKKDIYEVKKCLGNNSLNIPKSAKKNITGRRSLYICRNILKGEKFSYYNIKSVRPFYGMHPKYLTKVIGKKAKRDLFLGDPLKKEHVKNL